MAWSGRFCNILLCGQRKYRQAPVYISHCDFFHPGYAGLNLVYVHVDEYRALNMLDYVLFHTYWDFRIKFSCVKKRFGFYSDQSERRNEFLIRVKIVSSNHKPRLKRIVFSQAFSRAFQRSSRVPLSGSFDKIIYFRCTRVVRNSNLSRARIYIWGSQWGVPFTVDG